VGLATGYLFNCQIFTIQLMIDFKKP